MVEVVSNPQAVINAVSKKDRKEKLEPLFRLINQKLGKIAWSPHWSKDPIPEQNLRDPATRENFEPLKMFILNNIDDLEETGPVGRPESFTPSQYLHAIEYDFQELEGRIGRRYLGDHARKGGIVDQELYDFHLRKKEIIARHLVHFTRTEARRLWIQAFYQKLTSYNLSSQGREGHCRKCEWLLGIPQETFTNAL